MGRHDIKNFFVMVRNLYNVNMHEHHEIKL